MGVIERMFRDAKGNSNRFLLGCKTNDARVDSHPALPARTATRSASASSQLSIHSARFRFPAVVVERPVAAFQRERRLICASLDTADQRAANRGSIFERSFARGSPWARFSLLV